MFGIRRLIYNLIAHYLTKPRKRYRQVAANDMANLKRQLRKGDVILIDGDQRVSEVIKYLTQSSWSHAAIYVGDELARRDARDRALLHGADARDVNHMIVEALMEGVVASPLSKYASFNLRVVRPRNLRREDQEHILDEIIGQLGYTYDVRHIVDLARFLFPVTLIPRRLRRRALQLGSGLTREVICSTMIARAFQNIGYPILPQIAIIDDKPTSRFARVREQITGGRRHHDAGIYTKQPPALITPRDFDLSPYFDILKFNHADLSNFDYRRIRWAPSDDDDAESATG